MSSTPQFDTAQLNAARAKAWHQDGNPLLTLDEVRTWISTTGLVLFSPRAQHLPAPAPSLVEATLGAANDAPNVAQSDTTKSIVARLVAEGNALPLNLLGGPGDLPDFVVSAQMFSFVFTLRGDKLWKQSPATSGSVKVSPLALAAYELLQEHETLTATELASELGREVTEAAVARAMQELWTHLRVLPLLRQGDAPTQWELTSRRFMKAIKSGVNAGQPTALSALVSLYLSQALLATEEEIATFLSPMAARSRIREVVHALSAGRQLEPVVLEGKTLLHVPGTLPEFPATVEVLSSADENTDSNSSAAKPLPAPAEGGRIKRFAPRAEGRSRADFKGKPAQSFGAGPRPASAAARDRGSRPPSLSGSKPERSDRERRPFNRDRSADGAEKRSFTRPWNENRKPRSEAASSDAAGEGPAERAFPRSERSGQAPASGAGGRDRVPKRSSFGSREGSSDRGPARKSFGEKPPFRKDRGEGFAGKSSFPKDRERRPFARRAGAESENRPRRSFAGSDRPRPRPNGAPDSERPFKKPRFGRPGNTPGDFAPKRPYVRREPDGQRPAYGGSNSKPRDTGPMKPPYVRRDRETATGERPRSPRPDSGRPFTSRDDRKPGNFSTKRPYTRRDDTAGERPARPSFGAKRTFGDKPAGRSSGFSGRPFRSPDGSDSGRPSRSDRSSRGSFGARTGGDGRPAGGSRERSGGRVPFGGKPAYGKRPAGGTRPTTRRKPEPKDKE